MELAWPISSYVRSLSLQHKLRESVWKHDHLAKRYDDFAISSSLGLLISDNKPGQGAHKHPDIHFSSAKEPKFLGGIISEAGIGTHTFERGRDQLLRGEHDVFVKQPRIQYTPTHRSPSWFH